ncbi:hypothetical protein F4775DRAFT_577486 [Biscogniauxia sp. FL1348]|nr:hypothetical protein F4775DRAFT_577486 [Biscogniauxia sp. FL1348]
MLDDFAAFSIGQRNCAGKPLAYLEKSIVNAKRSLASLVLVEKLGIGGDRMSLAPTAALIRVTMAITQASRRGRESL